MTELNDNAWEKYLKKYSPLYVTKRRKDKVYAIKCSIKKGEDNHIMPYDLGDTEKGIRRLCYVTLGTSLRRTSGILRKWAEANIKYDVAQRSEDGIMIVFEEKDLGAVVKVVRPKDRRAKKRITEGLTAPELEIMI